MHESLTERAKLMRRALAASLALLGLQIILSGASVASGSLWDSRSTEQSDHHYALDPVPCCHATGGTGGAIHCHIVAGAAQAIAAERSPDPKETVADNGVIAPLPRPASLRLHYPTPLPAGPPAFVLYSNFRS